MLIEEQSKEAEVFQKLKSDWINRKIAEGGEPVVIKFIAGVLFHGAARVSGEDSTETIRQLFEAGYCYYFAKMLEDAFPGGTAALCYPFGHIVYVYKEVAYDIGGVTDAEYEMLIPLTALGEAVDDFRHIPEKDYDLSEDQLFDIGEKCKREGLVINAITVYDKRRVHACRAVVKGRLTNKMPVEFAEYYQNYGSTMRRLTGELEKGNINTQTFDRLCHEECWQIGLSYDLIQRMLNEERPSGANLEEKPKIKRTRLANGF